MMITFTGNSFRQEEVCYSDFEAIVELIAAGYIILDVKGA